MSYPTTNSATRGDPHLHAIFDDDIHPSCHHPIQFYFSSSMALASARAGQPTRLIVLLMLNRWRSSAAPRDGRRAGPG